jgi:hypothetical protein
VDKTIYAQMEQFRSFDFQSFEHDVQVGLSWAMQDVCSGLSTPVVGGLIATQTSPLSLSFNLGAGRIYQIASNDASSAGAITQDLTQQAQQGLNPGQTITLVAPTAGLSQWNVLQGQFQQADAVRTNDPNGGIVPFYNAANPTVPIPTSVNTVRQGKFIVQVLQGTAVTTGSEVPPTPTAGWTPLYMVDLAGGQGTIQTSQILRCGPSAGTGVPVSYPVAPFLRGFMASHHGGVPGQAPKILLGSEVQGVLPYANMSPVRTLLTANLTLYVNPSTGSDSNSGLSPAIPFATVQGALNAMYRAYDWNGFAGTVSLANGTYTTGGTISGLPPGMFQPISVVGNVAAPGSVIFAVNPGNCFYVTQGGQLNVSGCTLGAGGVIGSQNGFGLFAWMGGILNFGSVTFVTCTQGHMLGQNGGSIFGSSVLGASYSITGGVVSGAHMASDAGGVCSPAGMAVTLTGTPAFSVAFALAQRSGVTQAPGSTYSGAASCPRFLAATGGNISGTSGNITFFPGSSAGSTGSAGNLGFYN